MLITSLKRSSRFSMSSDDKDLFNWVEANIEYSPGYKGVLLTAEEVFKTKKGHCWEISDFVFEELNSLSYTPYILYFGDEKSEVVTHTTVFYLKNNNWYWMETVVNAYKGIYSYNEKKNCIRFICESLKNINGISSPLVRIGMARIDKNENEGSFFNKLMKMEKYECE